MSETAARKTQLKQKAKHELRALLTIFLYLLFSFAPSSLTVRCC